MQVVTRAGEIKGRWSWSPARGPLTSGPGQHEQCGRDEGGEVRWPGRPTQNAEKHPQLDKKTQQHSHGSTGVLLSIFFIVCVFYNERRQLVSGLHENERPNRVIAAKTKTRSVFINSGHILYKLEYFHSCHWLAGDALRSQCVFLGRGLARSFGDHDAD